MCSSRWWAVLTSCLAYAAVHSFWRFGSSRRLDLDAGLHPRKSRRMKASVYRVDGRSGAVLHAPNHIAMIVANGCSMSTAISGMSIRMMHHHGFNVWTGGDFEFLKKEVKHPLMCRDVTANGEGVNRMWSNDKVERLRQASSVLLGKSSCSSLNLSRPTIFFLKMSAGHLSSELLGWARPETIRFAMMQRRNILDEGICVVKDCFKFVGRLGRPVDQNGTTMDTCFQRRSLNVTDATYKAKLDTKFLLHELRNLHKRSDQMTKALQSRYDLKVTYAEDLVAFEYSSDPLILQTSVAAWIQILQQMGIQPDREIIRQELKAFRGNKIRRQHDHAEEIYNAAEVKAVLQEAGPEYMTFWREER